MPLPCLYSKLVSLVYFSLKAGNYSFNLKFTILELLTLLTHSVFLIGVHLLKERVSDLIDCHLFIRRVLSSVHQEFADNLGIPFLETSAKSATNVEQAFMTMAAEIKKRMGPGATAGAAEKSNVKIQSKPVNTSSGGCC